MTRPIDELNALDEAEAEEVSGTSILALEGNAPKAMLFAALAWVHKRKANPEIGKFTAYAATARTAENIDYLFSERDEDGSVEGDPFPEGGGGEAERAPEGEADAEGAVLSGDGDQS